MENRNSYAFLIVVLMMVFGYNTYIVQSNIQLQNELIEAKYEMKVDSLENRIKNLERFRDSVSLYNLNWNNIEHWMDVFDIEHKGIVKQQIYLETGNLTSDICLRNNNLFGMRYPRVRETTAIGTRKSHAKYKNYVESIRDYALWQRSMYDGETEYYTFLKTVGYAECTEYINKLKYIERRRLYDRS